MDVLSRNTEGNIELFNYYLMKVDGEDMKGYLPRVDFRKLDGSKEDFQFQELYFIENELKGICKKIEEEPEIFNEAIIIGLKNYIIIKLVSVIEDSCKKLVKGEIDRLKINLKNFFNKNDILVRISDLDTLKNTEITKGALVASNFNFQNIYSINEVLSGIVGTGFIEKFLELLRLPNDSQIEFDKESYDERKKLTENWEEFLEIFDIRNKIIHRNENTELGITELVEFIDYTIIFINYTAYFIQIIWEIKNNEIREELDQEMAGVLGNTASTVISVVRKKQ